MTLYALKAADTFEKTLKPLLLHPFVHSIFHYSRNLRTIMMENHREKRKGTWTLSETRATFLFKRSIMMENHSKRQRRNRDPIKD